MVENEQDYGEMVSELESEVENVERDFQSIKSENPSESLAQKQDRAEEILSEIHEQLDFLKEHMNEIEERRENR